MAGLNPRNVHVLFVHGVGTHARLSSLLEAYQALRANIRSPEAPIELEDEAANWRLRQFDDGAGTSATPHLKLAVDGAAPGETEAVYLYEVNYSALAGVVRANQPIDLTGLFVGFDLAVNVARKRLKENPVKPRPAGSYDIDDSALALTVQKIAGVFVAATVPILGIPSLVFSRFTKGIVAVFTRFFEDVATFALDRNGEGLISAHVDRTVEGILASGFFKDGAEKYRRDILVIAAHSLGTIVTHSYLVRQGLKSGRELPARVLTFGSPIGLVCWLWLFLDFDGMDFNRLNLDPDAAHYFSWKPNKSAWSDALPPIQWINVVNHLDPIATAFPVDYVNLAQTPDRNAAALSGRCIHQRFMDTGSLAGAAHTAYFDDRKGFLKILARLCGLQVGSAEEVLAPGVAPKNPGDPEGRTATEHWRKGAAGLERLRFISLWVGWLAIGIYLGAIALAWKSWWPMAFVLLFFWPPLTIGALAFFQRLIYSRPTKRTSIQAIENLPWGDLHSKPHCMRQNLRLGQLKDEREYVLASDPGWIKKVLMWLLSFTPTLLAMLLPVAATSWFAADSAAAWKLLQQNRGFVVPGMLALFVIYLVAFAISEFAAHWRTAVVQATNPRPQR